MKTMSLRMPDYLKNAINDVCTNEKISLNQFILNALSEKVSALQTLDIIEQRAKRASKESFLDALSKVPSVEPDKRDRL
ncbi:MAG: toxin-antitoxin system HicB family antitoxin [Sulfurovum sp.]|nr:MAG: toxin-antitoxin system HicB family antitoxin [Sulfurovum sp.]